MEDLTTFSETKFKIALGEKEYNVNFGIHARRRIEEAKPGFTVLGSDMPDFEIVPFLLQAGIAPAERLWKSEDEFLELYENCTDEEGLAKVAIAFQNCLGFTNRQFMPVITRVNELLEEAKSKKQETKSPKE